MISGILQARMIPELAEEDGADRKEDHAGNADRFIAGVERKQREDRGEADLLADEARLKGLAREGRDGVEDQEADAAGGIAVQKFEQRPRNEDCACAEDGERVDERGQEGEKERIFRAEQEKPSRQNQESDAHELELGNAPASKRLTDHVEPVRNDNGIGKADFSDRAKMRITLTFLRYFSAQSA